jgi:hypothetical protein
VEVSVRRGKRWKLVWESIAVVFVRDEGGPDDEKQRQETQAPDLRRSNRDHGMSVQAMSFKAIARRIAKDPTTVSKEVKLHAKPNLLL